MCARPPRAAAPRPASPPARSRARTLRRAAPDDPVGIEWLPESGELVVMDSGNHRCRAVGSDGIVRTLAGDGAHRVRDGRGACSASLSMPGFVTAGAGGGLHVSQWDASCVRHVDGAGLVTTPLASELLGHVGGLALDGCGHVLVANAARHAIVRCVAEGGAVRYEVAAGLLDCSGRADGFGAAARFASPRGLALDGDGNLLVADSDNHCVRLLKPSGECTTLAGCGFAGSADGPARPAEPAGGRWLDGAGARFNGPRDVAIDAHGGVLVSDAGNNCIRRIVGAGLARPRPPARPLVSTHRADLLSMLQDEELSDVAFDVGGERVCAHRAVLSARSPYFRAMLKGSFREARQPAERTPIRIGEVSPGAFRQLLAYLYTDDLSVFTEEHLLPVLAKAAEMELSRVAAHALGRCTSGLSAANAAERLLAARRGGLRELEEAAFNFVAQHFKKVRDAAPESLRALSEADPRLFEAVVMQAVL